MSRPKFAPVAPLAIHRQLDAWGLLGDYHLLLTHQTIEEPYEYANFWQRKDAFVIMDNSAAEFGESLPWGKVLDAARLTNANIVVLPDRIGDRRQTLAWAQDYIAQVPSGMGTLGVAQGRTFDDVRACATGLVALGVDMVSIPRGVTFDVGSRIELVRWFGETFPETPVHLLGFSNNLLDDFSAALSAENVQGIDSAVPLWLPQMLPATPPTDADFGKRPEDYDAWSTLPYPEIASANLGTARWWLALGAAADAPMPGRAPSHPEDQSTES